MLIAGQLHLTVSSLGDLPAGGLLTVGNESALLLAQSTNGQALTLDTPPTRWRNVGRVVAIVAAGPATACTLAGINAVTISPGNAYLAIWTDAGWAIHDAGTAAAAALADALGGPGQQGEQGEPGEPGVPGVPGVAGSPGAAGSPGSPGTDGEDGEPGIPGTTGATGPAGSSGAAGAAGAAGVPGEEGEPGEAGSPGATGPAGAPGGGGLTHPQIMSRANLGGVF